MTEPTDWPATVARAWELAQRERLTDDQRAELEGLMGRIRERINAAEQDAAHRLQARPGDRRRARRAIDAGYIFATSEAP